MQAMQVIQVPIGDAHSVHAEARRAWKASQLGAEQGTGPEIQQSGAKCGLLQGMEVDALMQSRSIISWRSWKCARRDGQANLASVVWP